jgi:hypothetical protein
LIVTQTVKHIVTETIARETEAILTGKRLYIGKYLTVRRSACGQVYTDCIYNLTLAYINNNGKSQPCSVYQGTPWLRVANIEEEKP